MSKMPIEKREVSNSRVDLGCMSFGGGWNRYPILTLFVSARGNEMP